MNAFTRQNNTGKPKQQILQKEAVGKQNNRKCKLNRLTEAAQWLPQLPKKKKQTNENNDSAEHSQTNNNKKTGKRFNILVVSNKQEQQKIW